MAVSKTKKARHGIIMATSMCLFSLFSVFSATYAWFSTNLNTETKGMEIKVKTIELDYSAMTIHRCDLSASSSAHYHFFSTPSAIITNSGSTSVAGIKLDNYSKLNKTQPLLLLFTLTDEVYEDDVTVSAISENDSFTTEITAQNVAHFPFSSAVRFKSMSYAGENFPFDNVLVSDLSSYTSFASVSGQTTSFTNTIQPFNGESHSIIKYIAIVMDYYPDAIDYIFNQNLGVGSIAANNNNAVDFYCDWTFEI